MYVILCLFTLIHTDTPSGNTGSGTNMWWQHQVGAAGARHRKRESTPFPLTFDMVSRKFIITGFRCTYCHRFLVSTVGKGLNGEYKNWTATLERIDESLGYRDTNVIIACFGCNAMAMGMSPDQKAAHCTTFGSRAQFDRQIQVARDNVLSDSVPFRSIHSIH